MGRIRFFHARVLCVPFASGRVTYPVFGLLSTLFRGIAMRGSVRLLTQNDDRLAQPPED